MLLTFQGPDKKEQWFKVTVQLSFHEEKISKFYNSELSTMGAGYL